MSRGWRLADTEELRLLAFESLSRLTPRLPSQIRPGVERELGPTCRRRLTRALAWLHAHGIATRTPEGYLATPDGHQRMARIRLLAQAAWPTAPPGSPVDRVNPGQK